MAQIRRFELLLFLLCNITSKKPFMLVEAQVAGRGRKCRVVLMAETVAVRGQCQQTQERHRSRDGESGRIYRGKKINQRGRKVRQEGSEAWLYYILIRLPHQPASRRAPPHNYVPSPGRLPVLASPLVHWLRQRQMREFFQQIILIRYCQFHVIDRRS